MRIVASPVLQIPLHEGDVEALHQASNLSAWWIVPFVLFLLMIATGPLFYPRFWHKYFTYISITMGGGVAMYYLFGLQHVAHVVHAGVEYVQFISLLAALYFASSGIRISFSQFLVPRTNVLFLLIGGILANLIGTTGASILLIHPFLSLNRKRVGAYHIVFFIFIVSNVGGALTPIGDPPLFLGFLKGVPFQWTLFNNFLPWCFVMGILLSIFYLIDEYHLLFDGTKKHKLGSQIAQLFTHLCASMRDALREGLAIIVNRKIKGRVIIRGTRNVWALGVVIAAVFLDPGIFKWVPSIFYHGEHISFLREIILLSVAFLSYRLANKSILKSSNFSTFPIKEVALVFIGIFGTMIPALELLDNFMKTEMGRSFCATPSNLYWGTGLLSGFLDNAPTYLSFLTGALSCLGGCICNGNDVLHFAEESHQFIGLGSRMYLQAISLAAVFFGAMTYIGNGPNFMIRAIAKQRGVPMPHFFAYMIRYSIPILVPTYFLVWLLFIR